MFSRKPKPIPIIRYWAYKNGEQCSPLQKSFKEINSQKLISTTILHPSYLILIVFP